MSFRFDFNLTEAPGHVEEGENEALETPLSEESNDDEQPTTSTSVTAKPFAFWSQEEVERILLRLEEQPGLEYELVKCKLDDGHDAIDPPLRKVHRSAEDNNEKLVQELEEMQTDIITGVYEGGLKVWECSVDLCLYLAENKDSLLNRNNDGRQKHVMELGCGHGLPGCYLLREGATVLFTDYNDFVVRNVTLSNIVLNCIGQQETVAQRVLLGAGDWMDMSSQLSSHCDDRLPKDGRFDVILSAETTYTDKAARETALLMARHLVPGTGVGLVANKRYYFGVGGGSDAFRQACDQQECFTFDNQSYLLDVEKAKVYNDGASNIREILRVTLRPGS